LAPPRIRCVAPCFWRVLTFMSKPLLRLCVPARANGDGQKNIIHGLQ